MDRSNKRNRYTIKNSIVDRTAVGDDTSVNITQSPETHVNENLPEVQAKFLELQAQILRAQLGATQGEALSKAKELESAITDNEVDTKKVGEIRSWFATYAPAVLGAVVGVLASPPVGALVAAGGTAAGAAYKNAAGLS